jgi:hypothetical protein
MQPNSQLVLARAALMTAGHVQARAVLDDVTQRSLGPNRLPTSIFAGQLSRREIRPIFMIQ